MVPVLESRAENNKDRPKIISLSTSTRLLPRCQPRTSSYFSAMPHIATCLNTTNMFAPSYPQAQNPLTDPPNAQSLFATATGNGPAMRNVSPSLSGSSSHTGPAQFPRHHAYTNVVSQDAQPLGRPFANLPCQINGLTYGLFALMVCSHL